MIQKILPYLIIVVLHTVGFLYACQSLNIYLKDSFEYLNLAKNLLEEFEIYSGDSNKPFLPQLVSLRPPFYGLFIGITKLFISNNLIIIFTQGVISICNILLLMKIVKQLFQTNYNLFIAVCILFYPSQIVYANMIMSEILFQLFVLLFIYMYVLHYKNQLNKYLLYACITMCFLILTKSVGLFIFASYIVFTLLSIAFNKLPSHAIVYPMITLICLLGYQYYNYQKTGYYHYTSITSTYLLNYQLYPVLIEKDKMTLNFTAQASLDSINAIAEREDTFKNYSKKRISLTIDELKKHKTIFFFKTTVGLLSFFLDPGKWDIKEFLISKHYMDNFAFNIYIWMSFFFRLILCFLFLFALYLLIKNISVFWLIALVVFSVALASGTSGSARFHLPVYPLFIILCILSLQNPVIKAFTDKFRQESRF